jgi:hypothetical protein
MTSGEGDISVHIVEMRPKIKSPLLTYQKVSLRESFQMEGG